jgi:hypothetical protein
MGSAEAGTSGRINTDCLRKILYYGIGWPVLSRSEMVWQQQSFQPKLRVGWNTIIIDINHLSIFLWFLHGGGEICHGVKHKQSGSQQQSVASDETVTGKEMAK